MRRVIVPQAARVAVPNLMNSFIDLFKATSLCYTIGLRDMMGGATMEIQFLLPLSGVLHRCNCYILEHYCAADCIAGEA